MNDPIKYMQVGDRVALFKIGDRIRSYWGGETYRIKNVFYRTNEFVVGLNDWNDRIYLPGFYYDLDTFPPFALSEGAIKEVVKPTCLWDYVI